MIKVLFVESGRTGGGSFESLYQHLRAIDRDRIWPMVVCLNESRYVHLIQELGIPIYVLTDLIYSDNAPRRLKAAAVKIRSLGLRLNRLVPALYPNILQMVHTPLVNGLARLVRETAIDVVHLNVSVYRDFFGLFVAQRTGVRCVSHLRSVDPRGKGEFNSRMSAMSNRGIDVFVANSHETAGHWREQRIDADKTRIVHNGVSTAEVTPLNVREVWDIDDSVRFCIGCVTPLRSRMKVQEFLIRSFARFLNKHPNSVLFVVGDGPIKQHLEREAAELNIDGKVVFTGYQEKAKEIIAGLDVSLVMNTRDSFSRVALETMQAKTPLVATDVGGIRELVRHGENGLLRESGDEEAFVAAVGEVLLNEDMRYRLVENGYRTIQEGFSIERYASDMEGVYADLVVDK